ncbi:MAG: hypothetical protein ACMXX6_01110 [Candidatus Woesearchaeota archaeon]
MKKISLSLFSVLAFLPIVSANDGLPIPDFILELIRIVWSGDPSVVYLRFVIFIGVFTIFYAILQKTIFGKGQTNRGGVSIALAIVLALIATITMPQTVVELIFNMYSGIFGLILLFGPVLYLLYFVYKEIPGDSRGGHLIRVLVLLIITALLTSRSLLNNFEFLREFGADQYIILIGSIIFILAIIELVRAFSGGGSDRFSGSTSAGYGNYDNASSKGTNPYQNRKDSESLSKSLADALNKNASDEEKDDSSLAKVEKDTSEETKKFEEYKNYVSELSGIVENIGPEDTEKMDKAIDLLINVVSTKISPELEKYEKNDIKEQRDKLLHINKTVEDTRNICNKIIENKERYKDTPDILTDAENLLEFDESTEKLLKDSGNIINEFETGLAKYKTIISNVNTLKSNKKNDNINSNQVIVIIKELHAQLDKTVKTLDANSRLIDNLIQIQEQMIRAEKKLSQVLTQESKEKSKS